MLSKLLFSLSSIVCFFSTLSASMSHPNYREEKLDVISKEMVSDFADDPNEVALKDDVLFLLDIKKNNYLFRGNLPEENGHFCYGGLIKDMNACLGKQGKKLSANFQLISISFLNPLAEYEKIEAEKNGFLRTKIKAICVFILFLVQ